MAFHNDRLPDKVELQSNYRHRHNTTLWIADSGREQRNIKWSRFRGGGNVGFAAMEAFDAGDGRPAVDLIVDHFHARQGRANTFPFKDWADYNIGDQDDPATTRQTIGTGDGDSTGGTTAFQIFKRYTSGSTNYDRDIYLLASGTLFVYLDGVLQTEGSGQDYLVDETTGIITFSTAPLSGVVVAVTVQFYNHVRYDIDDLEVMMETDTIGRVPNLPIVEVLEVPS